MADTNFNNPHLLIPDMKNVKYALPSNQMLNWTAPEDCFVCMTGSCVGGIIYVSVNSNWIAGIGGVSGIYASASFPMKRGDVLTTTQTGSAYSLYAWGFAY